MIEVIIKGRELIEPDEYEHPVEGNVNKDSVRFTIDGDDQFDGMVKRVGFYQGDDEPVMVDYADTIIIPWEAIQRNGRMYVSIIGYNAEKVELLRTKAMRKGIIVDKKGKSDGDDPSEPTLDVVSRIDNLAADLEHKRDTDYWRGEPGKDADIAGAEAAKDAANKAAESAIDAAASANSATSDANNAATNANDAAASANSATSDANNAATNANEAAESANNAATNANKSATNADTATTNANAAATEAHGAAANANEAAVNANETANQIKQRADSGEFNGSDGYSPTANVAKVGGTATITVTDKNGTTTATVSDGAPGKDGSDAAATDVRIAGKSITADGVADIPTAVNNGPYGVVKIGYPELYGIQINSNGYISNSAANNAQIDAHAGWFNPIVPSNLDYAVKAAMTDGKGAAWIADEQKAARERMNAADANKVYIMQKQIENLQGIAATEETDSTEAYTKTVPTGAQKWASLDNIGGKTVVWNQLVQNGDFADGTTRWSSGGCTISVTGGVLKMDIAGATYAYAQVPVKIEIGHKYFIKVTIKNEVQDSTAFAAMYAVDTIINGDVRITAADGWKDYYAIKSCASSPADVNKLFRVVCSNSAAMSGSVYAKNCYAIDLTHMFGAGNEPSTVEEFRAMFPADYYPYNPGELMSAEVVEVESKGKNLFDLVGFAVDKGAAVTQSGDTISVTPTNAMYGEPFVFSEVDIPVTISAKSISTVTGTNPRVQILRKDGSTATEINTSTLSNKASGSAVRLNWSISGTFEYEGLQIERGTTATPYSPYFKGTFIIPQSVREMCPGYGWSAGTVCNEIDFERKVYVQRVGKADADSVTWSLGSTTPNENGVCFLTADVLNVASPSQDASRYLISNIKLGTGLWGSATEDEFWLNAETLFFRFKTSKTSGITLADGLERMRELGAVCYYPLAEPVEVDLSDVLTDDNFIEVESGGAITFKQASTQLPVPSSVTYQISTKEAIANA